MRAREVTLAETLRAAGYRTGIFGKWHNGEQFPLTPPGQGFEEFVGFTAGHWNHYFDAEQLRGAQPHPTQGYLPDALTDAAIDFITRHRASPFFCYVPFNTPHSPHQVPDRYFDKYTAKGCNPEHAAIYGMCENIDDNVGRLLAALDRLQLRDNTIVLFLTDNGPGHSERYNAGMRGKKASVHEGGTRVPLFLQFPARFREPRLVREISAHIDLYPTLLELAGVPLPAAQPALDGVSLVPLLEGRGAGWPDRLLFTMQSGAAAVPTGRPGAVRSQRYRAVLENNSARWQLYDMVDDPGQKQDIAAARPEIVRDLAAAYDAWWRDVSREGFARPPIPVGHPEHNPVRLYAPQAELSGRNLRFFIPQAYSNTWITDWTDTAAKIAFPLEVASAGTYEVTFAYASAESDAGARVRVRSDRSATAAEVTVPAAPAPRLPLPHRDGHKDNYIDRTWGTLSVGRISLPAGPQTLTIEALAKPGKEVLELKHVELRLLPASAGSD
jgi:arylsulfatase A